MDVLIYLVQLKSKIENMHAYKLCRATIVKNLKPEVFCVHLCIHFHEICETGNFERQQTIHIKVLEMPADIIGKAPSASTQKGFLDE